MGEPAVEVIAFLFPACKKTSLLGERVPWVND